jgi:hypothetical protein
VGVAAQSVDAITSNARIRYEPLTLSIRSAHQFEGSGVGGVRHACFGIDASAYRQQADML